MELFDIIAILITLTALLLLGVGDDVFAGVVLVLEDVGDGVADLLVALHPRPQHTR